MFEAFPATVHGDLGRTLTTTNIVPLYALSNKNNTLLYLTNLNPIKNREATKNNTDFEEEVIQAFQQTFVAADDIGCYVNFKNKLWRKAILLKL